MEISLQCPACDGAAVFRSRALGSRGRLVGRCTQCSSAYSLHGGQLSEIDRKHYRPLRIGHRVARFGRGGQRTPEPATSVRQSTAKPPFLGKATAPDRLVLEEFA